MKNSFAFFFIILVIASCKKAPEQIPDSDLTGTSWVMITPGDVIVIQFSGTSSGELQEITPSGRMDLKFTYTVAGNSVRLTVENGYIEARINGATFTIKGTDGSDMNFAKKKNSNISLSGTRWHFKENSDILNLSFNASDTADLRILAANKLITGELQSLPVSDTIYMSGGDMFHKIVRSGDQLKYMVGDEIAYFSKLEDLPAVTGTRWVYKTIATRLPYDSISTIEFLPNNLIDEKLAFGFTPPFSTIHSQFKYVRDGNDFYYSLLTFIHRFSLQENSLLYTSYDGKTGRFEKQ